MNLGELEGEKNYIPTPGEDLEHHEFGELLQYFGPTWWEWDEESFNILPEAGTSLEDMFSRLQVEPNRIQQTEDRIFEARYELPVYKGTLQYEEAIFVEDVVGFLDFVIGIPYGCIERIGVVGEDTKEIIGVRDDSHSAPPLLGDLFREKQGMNSLYNLIWLDYENTKSFAEPLSETLLLQKHWWLRFNLIGYNDTRPIPGEFLTIALFIFPNQSWGWQRSNPSLFSGNWTETVFYTSGIVKEVLDDTSYLVQYRKEKVRAISSDWTKYKIDDRVTVLKEVNNKAESFLWRDLEEYHTEVWVLTPITFYEES